MAQRASRKTNPVLERNSRNSKARHVASSQTQSKVSFWAQDAALTHQVNQATTTQLELDPISSGDEEFNLQTIGEDEDVSDVLPNGPPSLHPVVTDTVLNSSRPARTHAALDILHFFTEIEFPNATKSNERVQKVCKLCMWV
jgi:hypothetical protein